jgi:cell division protein FtsX
MSNVEEQVKELADEAKQSGVFNIVDAIKGRAYPSEQVSVFLTEDTAYEASKIKEKMDSEAATLSDSKMKELNKKLEELVKKMDSEKFIFTITGISEGDRDSMLESVLEKFPMEYDEQKNPFTGEVKKVELENKQRDKIFTDMIWKSHIVKIVSPDGSEQKDLTDSEIEVLRTSLPLASIAAINEAIEKVRVASAVFMASLDEDFLAKS